MKNERRAWWKECVVYQIYPRSFCDSNGDGIGDLQGIISKLDYLQDLGIGAIWLCPIYPSPNADNGYDISDYNSIMPEFGAMRDFDALTDAIHKRGMKLILDMVLNHSSDEHPIFLQSRSSKENRYRDWYIWRDGKEGGPPNNWGSSFGGPAWEYCEERGQYYLHLFAKKQPDWNWENPEVREYLYAVLNWWAARGVDGFRLDVVNYISKDTAFPDGAIMENGFGDFSPYAKNGPRIHEYLKEMNQKVLENHTVMLVGEMPGAKVSDAKRYTNGDEKELDMVFHFDHMYLDGNEFGRWGDRRADWKALHSILCQWQYALGAGDVGWNSLYMGNHDQPRMVSRFGNDGEYWKRSAKLLATYQFCMKGTVFLYQGDELGMKNAVFCSMEQYRDIESIKAYEEMLQHGIGSNTALRWIGKMSRDNARTPMQWTAGRQAGFTGGTPWIEINQDYKMLNAEAQRKDEVSVLCYYKKLIALKAKYEALVYGAFEDIDCPDSALVGYRRLYKGQQFTIWCNPSAGEVRVPDDMASLGDPLLSNMDDLGGKVMRPYEARIYLKTTGSEEG